MADSAPSGFRCWRTRSSSGPPTSNSRRVSRSSVRNRYYWPMLGRFVTADPIGLWGDGYGVGNGYVYAGNSPAFLVDPFGEQVVAGRCMQCHGDWRALNGGAPLGADIFGTKEYLFAIDATLIAAEVGLALASLGASSVATTAAKEAIKEVAEAAAEAVLKQAAKEAAKEGVEQGAKRAAKETVGACADDVAKAAGKSADKAATGGARPNLGKPGTRRNPDGAAKNPADQLDEIEEAQRRNPGAIESTEKSKQNPRKSLDNYDPDDWK